MTIYESQKKYDKKNTKQFMMKLNLKYDADIIDKLESVKNRQGYIKDLIRNDIAAHEEEQDGRDTRPVIILTR